MTKAQLIDKVKATCGNDLTKKVVAEVVDSVFSTLKIAIKQDERFHYPGFGTFTVKDRKAREGRNPRTGKPIQIAASKTVTFKPAPSFKKEL